MPAADSATVITLALAALALVGLALKWFIEHETQLSDQTEKRIGDLEAEVKALQQDYSEQRRLKHDALNRAGGLAMAARLLLDAGRKCSCGEMASVVELVDGTRVMEGEQIGRQP